jgi:FecR protein
MRHLAYSQRGEWFKNHFVFQLLLAVALTSVAYSQDNNNVRAVRISAVEGTVQILDDNGVVFDQAHANMPVTQEMHLKTGDDGRAEVQFEDGSVARITPNSAISFDQLQRTGDGNTVTQIQAAAGLTYYEFNNRGGKYAVRFGPYTATATKSSIFRVAVDQNPAQIAVMRGAVHIDTGNDGGLDVLTSQTATLDMKDTTSYDVAQSITADSWDQWNSDRDQLLAQMGAKATMARAMGANPDDAAWNDLDASGNWYDMPGYGMGWTPVGGSGFDPFGSGYWGYYPAYGYTWISSYSWGWLPYHCGAWNWFNGPGWMWFPGNCGWGAFGNGWYPVVTVWNCPPNYVVPTRPITPIRAPFHMPPQQALVAVNRNPGNFQLRTTDGSKQVATPIEFNGKTIHPIETLVVPRVSGPLGESFSVASGYVPPPKTGVRSGVLPSEGIRGTYSGSGAPAGAAPRNTFAPPAYRPAPGSGGSAPHYAAPSTPSYSPAPHMSSPPASSSAGAHPH